MLNVKTVLRLLCITLFRPNRNPMKKSFIMKELRTQAD